MAPPTMTSSETESSHSSSKHGSEEGGGVYVHTHTLRERERGGESECPMHSSHILQWNLQLGTLSDRDNLSTTPVISIPYYYCSVLFDLTKSLAPMVCLVRRIHCCNTGHTTHTLPSPSHRPLSSMHIRKVVCGPDTREQETHQTPHQQNKRDGKLCSALLAHPIMHESIIM